MSIATRRNPYTLFPLDPRYERIWSLYKKQQSLIWTAEEIDLHDDRLHWTTVLNDDERHFVKRVLAFFSSADSIVFENITERLLSGADYGAVPEVRVCLGFQAMMENVHAETYAILIDTYLSAAYAPVSTATNASNQSYEQLALEKDQLFHAIETLSAVRAKAEWAQRWIRVDQPLVVRLAAWLVVEGVFFSSSFCAIFWLKKRGLMPGLTFSNELISRDEGLHCDTTMELMLLCAWGMDLHKYREQILGVFRDGLRVEEQFVRDALPVALIGINAASMIQYVHYVANRFYKQLFSVDNNNNNTQLPVMPPPPNPFEWMELISLTGKTNFFEKRVSEYQKASTSGRNKNNLSTTTTTTANTRQFVLDADF